AVRGRHGTRVVREASYAAFHSMRRSPAPMRAVIPVCYPKCRTNAQEIAMAAVSSVQPMSDNCTSRREAGLDGGVMSRARCRRTFRERRDVRVGDVGVGGHPLIPLTLAVTQFIICLTALNSRLIDQPSSLGRYGKWLSDQELSRARNCLASVVSR